MVAGMSFCVGVGVGVLGCLLLGLLLRKKEIMDPGRPSNPPCMGIGKNNTQSYGVERRSPPDSKKATLLYKQADKLVSPSNPPWGLGRTILSPMVWSRPDWMKASLLYKQAADGFLQAKDYQNAIKAYEKASQGQKILLSPFNAAKHMEFAAVAAEKLNNLDEACVFYKTASDLYLMCEPCGRPEPAADVLSEAAVLFKDSSPRQALELYKAACVILENNDMIPATLDLLRCITLMNLKLSNYCEAAAYLSKCGHAASKCEAIYQLRDAFYSAIIIYLYAGETKKAQECYKNWFQIDPTSLPNNREIDWAKTLLTAYEKKDINKIKHVARFSFTALLEVHDILDKLDGRCLQKQCWSKEEEEEDQLQQPLKMRSNNLD